VDRAQDGNARLEPGAAGALAEVGAQLQLAHGVVGDGLVAERREGGVAHHPCGYMESVITSAD
jgi:hypothetical protein